MISKQRKKHIRRAFARHGMFFGYWLVGVLPFCFVKIVLKGLLAIVFYFAKRLRKITRESLMIAFGEQKNEEEIQKITHGCFAAIGKNIIELMYYLHHPARAPKIFSFEGREHLDQALAQGKGVIAVTAHFGNFPLMLLDLAQEGYKINVIMREARDKKVAKYILKIMSDRMVHTIHTKPRRKCVMEAFRTLRNNEILFILMDQHFGSDGGVFVDFFGRQAATATGPVVFAERSGAPIVPLFCVRDGEDRQKIVIEPPVALEQSEDRTEATVATVAKLTNIIEKYIRKYPAEWGWMHRRWKAEQ